MPQSGGGGKDGMWLPINAQGNAFLPRQGAGV
jgi:hypothetical protein